MKKLLSFLIFAPMLSANVLAQSGCQAYFYADSNACPNVTFVDYSYVDSLNGDYIVSYAWDFGDGNTSNFPYGSNIYTANGVYTACLTITTFMGCTSTYCEAIDIGCVGSGGSCQAWFFPDSVAPCPSVNFVNGSYSPVGIMSYFYDFGDGSTSTAANPTHTYASDGQYMACLTIIAGDSCTSTYCQMIMIDCISGLEEEMFAQSYVSPNPAQNQLTLHLEHAQDIQYRILGMNGAVYAEGMRPAQLAHAFELDGLSQGMYLLEIEAQGKRAVHRFISE